MIVLLTPTGMRPKQINLCYQWMKAQDCKDPVTWIIIDDGIIPTIDEIEPFGNWEIKKIFPEPKWKAGMNTQCRNLYEGLKVAKTIPNIDFLSIIEDDDYYSSRYLSTTNMLFKEKPDMQMFGETSTIYYNPKVRKLIQNHNRHHSSLFQTSFRPSIFPLFETILQNSPQFIDIVLWREATIRYSNYFARLMQFKEPLSVGIKGMAGRPGIGYGHSIIDTGDDFLQFRNLIGDDALKYIE